MTSVPDRAKRGGVALDGRTAALLVLALAILIGLVVASSPRDDVFEMFGPTMGTTYSVKIDAEIDLATRERMEVTVERILTRVNRLMSTYDSTSEISRFNQFVSVEPFRVSYELLEVLARAHTIRVASDGFFDVTVAPLVDAWGFGPRGIASESLDSATVATLRGRVGNDGLVLDASTRTVTKTDPEIRIDLSAIAKGYGVDLLAVALEQLGFNRYLVEVGGELRAGAAKRDGTPWSVGIERPEPQARRIHAVVHLSNQAIATSGDYRQFRDAGGRQRAHLIDPHTGSAIPVSGTSVSVVDSSAAIADAWATALAVAGYDRGYELALRGEVAALFLASAGDTIRSRATPAFRARVLSFEEVRR